MGRQGGICMETDKPNQVFLLFWNGGSIFFLPLICKRVKVKVTGETLVQKKIFPGFMLGKSLLYVVKNPIFPNFLA